MTSTRCSHEVKAMVFFGVEMCLGTKILSPGTPRDKRFVLVPRDYLLGSQETGDSLNPRIFSHGNPSDRITNIIQHLLDCVVLTYDKHYYKFVRNYILLCILLTVPSNNSAL